MKVPFVDLKIQHQSLQAELNEAIQRVLARGDFALGEDVARLEEEFAAYCGTRYAIGVDSGLSALELSLLALEVGPGDDVLVPTHTFIASAAAATFIGARPVFVDCDPATYNIDVALLEAALTPRTRAIIPVHLYGQPAEMDAILAFAERHHLVVVEDACQAHGARYHDRRAGSMGQAAAFSFYPSKNLGAYGDAGMVVTNDPEVDRRIRAMRNCGQMEKYVHELPPYNHRLDTLQAAILRVKLRHLDAWNAARRHHAALYHELLADAGLILPVTPDSIEPVWHLYVIQADKRDELRQHLSEQGIATGIHYPIPNHLQPFYRDLSCRRGDFPVTENCVGRLVSLPMYPELTSEAIEYVASTIRHYMGERTQVWNS